jgi:hypothetical protein
MTDEQIKIVGLFEERVNKLLFLCGKLKKENAELSAQLASEQASNEKKEREIKDLKIKYENLMTARVISVGHDDFKVAGNKLTELVREIDECIALLNNS